MTEEFFTAPSHRTRGTRALTAGLLLGTVLGTAACGGSGGSGSTKQVTDSSGVPLSVTVMAIDPDARPHTQFEAAIPHAADRTIAVEISVKNLLPRGGYYGTPGHALAVVGGNGRVYPADLTEDITHSPVRDTIVELSPGQSETEWVPVPIPRSVNPSTLRWQDDGSPVTDWSLTGISTITAPSGHANG
jgi:hypothetical protein